MSKSEYHSDTCDYCSDKATVFITFMSGEPVSMCDSEICKEKHTELQESEAVDFIEAGLI